MRVDGETGELPGRSMIEARRARVLTASRTRPLGPQPPKPQVSEARSGSRARFGFAFLAVALLAFLLSPSAPATPEPAAETQASPVTPSASSLLAGLPSRFEPNMGQVGDGIAYTLRAKGYLASLGANNIYFAFSEGGAPENPVSQSGLSEVDQTPAQRSVLAMSFVGANPNPEINALDPQEGISNYFLGNDPENWHANVPGYSKIHYTGLYDGIDMVIYDDAGQVRYDFIVAPGANPAQIEIAFEGAENLKLSNTGDLVVSSPYGDLTHKAPYSYQDKTEIESSFEIRGEQAGFRLGAYDQARGLTIDPALAYSSYQGGALNDSGESVAVDAAGAAYIAGNAVSVDFPTVAPYQASRSGVMDAIVTKVASGGGSVVYATYLGGSGNDDRGNGIAVDSSGAAYITGQTDSSNFPTASPFQGTYGGGTLDAFVTKLAASGGSLAYSTYLGGSLSEEGHDIDVDSLGAAHIVGQTQSTNFPVAAAYQGSNASGWEVFFTKVSPSGGSLTYSSYLGGSSIDSGYGLAIDASGALYLAGYTYSADFPTAGSPFQPAYAGAGNSDCFITKVAPGGGSLVYSGFLGGTGFDSCSDVDIDPTGAAYLSGGTESTNFPVAGSPYQSSKLGPSDAIVTKFTPNGSSLSYSTHFGGSSDDWASDIAVDSSGAAYIVGKTDSFANFPTVGAFDSSFGGGTWDGFIAKLAPSGQSLGYSSFLGGSNQDLAYGMALDSSGAAFVTGATQSSNFPTASPFQAANGGSSDVFITRVGSNVVSTTYLAEGSTQGGFQTWILVANPSLTATAQARLTFFTSTGPVPGPTVEVQPQSRRSINANSYVTDWNVSTKVEGLDSAIIAERALYSAQAGLEGAHLGKGMDTPANSWFLPEGSTGPGYETWVLVANPDATLTATVTITYMTGTGPVTGPVFVLAPQSRQSVRVNDTVSTFDVSTKVDSTGAAVLAERATYVSTGAYKGATDSPGTPVVKPAWYLGEGSTGPGFDTWILVANPNPVNTATVNITYYTSSGAVALDPFALAPLSRKTVKANDKVPNDWNVSTKVESSGAYVVAERAMYSSPGSGYGMTAATGEGVESPATNWLLAEGASAGGFDTWILVANPDPANTANVAITYLTGSGQVAGPTFGLAPQTRQSIKVNNTVSTFDVSTRVSVTNGVGVIADHAIYSPPGPYRDGTAGPGAPLL